MKIKIKEINKKKFKANEDLESGVYHGTYDGEDRIIVVSAFEDKALVIDDAGEIQTVFVNSIANLYTDVRKISDLKIEFEAQT